MHETIIVLVIIPILTFVLSRYFESKADARNRENQFKQRQLTRHLQASANASSFIEELQKDFADFLSTVFQWRFHGEPSAWIPRSTLNQIILRLESEGIDSTRFSELAEKLLAGASIHGSKEAPSDFYCIHCELFSLSNEIVKVEKAALSKLLLNEEQGKLRAGD